MNNQENKESFRDKEKRALPFFFEFVKFSIIFAIIVMLALLALSAADAAIS